jgi:Domain of unknown function (DUF4189)
MFRVSTAVAALFLLCVGAEAASYGAIAFSPDSGAYGYSTRRVSRANAQEWAMSYCDENAWDCRIAVNFHDACGAVARGRNGGWGTNWGYSRAEAQNNAMAACHKRDSGCRVVVWACSK